MTRALPAVHELRACQLCTHSRVVSSSLYCQHRTVAGGALVVACHGARLANGGCGPDARHMDYPAIQIPLRDLRPLTWATA